MEEIEAGKMNFARKGRTESIFAESQLRLTGNGLPNGMVVQRQEPIQTLTDSRQHCQVL